MFYSCWITNNKCISSQTVHLSLSLPLRMLLWGKFPFSFPSPVFSFSRTFSMPSLVKNQKLETALENQPAQLIHWWALPSSQATSILLVATALCTSLFACTWKLNIFCIKKWKPLGIALIVNIWYIIRGASVENRDLHPFHRFYYTQKGKINVWLMIWQYICCKPC